MVPPKVTDDPRQLKVMVDQLSAQLREIFAKLPADHPQRADLRANMEAIQEANEQLLPAYDAFLSEEAALAKRVDACDTASQAAGGPRARQGAGPAPGA